MDTTLSNTENKLVDISEYEKMKLCRMATVLKDTFDRLSAAHLQYKTISGEEVGSKKYIKFPEWLWYRFGGVSMTCKKLTENLENILSLSLQWEDGYIYLCIRRVNDGISEYARFDNSNYFEKFLNCINIRNQCKYTFANTRLFQSGCVPTIIYEV